MRNALNGLKRRTNRRSFVKKGLAAAGTATVGAGLLTNTLSVEASGGLTPGDAALLRFAAAAEILESDFWIQYNELGGVPDSEVPGGTGSAAYTAALVNLDSDMPVYIHDNTDDEITHFTFLNAYLASKGKATALCPAVRRPVPAASYGSPTSCSSPWTPVGGRGIAATRTTPTLTPRSRFRRQSPICLALAGFRQSPEAMPT